MTKVCKRHADNPVGIYHQCVGCELEWFREELEQKQQEVKRLNEERNRLFERLKAVKTSLGGVTFTDVREQEEKLIKKLREITNARLWSAYNAICDIVEDIEKEFSK